MVVQMEKKTNFLHIFTTFTQMIMHLVYPHSVASLRASSPIWASLCPSRVLARLTSLAQIGELARRLQLCITIDSDFSSALQWSQKKSKTMHMQNLGAEIKCIMIYVKMVNLKRGLSSKGFNPQRISRDLQWVVSHRAY